MNKGQHVHFVGIGGIGMSGIARVLLQMGWTVSGSDLRSSTITQKLAQMGAITYEGHDAANLEQADLVVLSSAIPANNPEVVEARRRGLPIHSRSQMLAFLMKERFGIAVAGTHGKTTTTSMVARVLESAGLAPTVIIGGEVNDIGSNAKLGRGEHLVAEADESDASFLDLDPRIAVITNIDSDVNLSSPSFADLNFDYDQTMDRVTRMFREFMHRVPDDGLLVLCTDNPRVREMVPSLERPFVTYGLDRGADLWARDVCLEGYGSTCTVMHAEAELGRLRLQVPGRHNIQNALAAVAVGLDLGLEFNDIARALASFEGVQRRFQIRAVVGGVTVVDDYAHNPSKVRAAIHAARASRPGRVVAVFQPHRYTRTKFLAHEFATAFEEADLLLVTDIYSAGEVPIVGVKAENIVELVRGHGAPRRVFHTPGKAQVLECLLSECRPGDLVITLGAGDVGAWGASLCEYLGKPPLERAAM